MNRSCLLLLAAAISCTGAQITEFVNCGGATQTEILSTPPQGLSCSQNGVHALVEVNGGILAFDVLGVPDPNNSQTVAEASLVATGSWLVTAEGATLPTYWSFCSAAFPSNGSGTGSATGSFGQFALGTGCSFSSAVPFPSTGSLAIDIDLSFQVSGDYSETLSAAPQFYDSNGNLIPAFGLTPLPDAPPVTGAPEPAMVIPFASVLIVWTFRRHP